LGMIQNNLDYLIIGKRLDSLRLGYYTMAFRVPELLIINLCYVISQALFPAYARLQDQPEALKKGFLLTLQYTSLFTVPVGVGLFFITPEFVQVVFSDRWLPAIPAMQALALYALVYSLSFNAGDIYKATGRPDILNKLSIVKLGLTIPALWVAAGYGIYAVALAQLLVNLILTLVRLGVIQRLLSLRLAELVAALRPAFTAALVMGAGIYLAQLGLSGTAPLARLIIIPIAGMLLYGLVIRLAHQDLTEQLIGLVQNIFLRKNSLGETAQ
jgi:lipopolysaccharide exporter